MTAALAAFLLYVCLVAPVGSLLVVAALPTWMLIVVVRHLARAGRRLARLWGIR